MPLDATLPSEASSPGFETTSLQTLPPELRQQIYNEIFKIYHCDYTYPFPYRIYTDTAHRGCRCGQGLSLTSNFFYKETRHLYYKHATFVFETPLSCVRFFNGIGSQSENIGALSISFSYREIYLLRTLFNRPSLVSNLHTLHLNYTSEPLRPFFEPIYLPSAQKNDPKIACEIQLKPGKHSLARLGSLRNLGIEGVIEDDEVQEALVKLSLNIENAARNEGAKFNKKELVWSTMHGPHGSEPFNLSLLPGAESLPLEELIFMSPENNKYGIAITYAISTKVIVKPEPCFGSSANTIEGFSKQFFRGFFFEDNLGCKMEALECDARGFHDRGIQGQCLEMVNLGGGEVLGRG
ncbi:uncharacterized protein RSE6_08356 [Rhynchosporium secalis]|uniref:F-box domain-containing protein n=1 Tax=Rhynchosporium secalis TaxID=38038 RepID=A0A1E1MFC1_RHYSE|nr:uncharacterized protein RSE6_08356 [Rhynchosporium secalis]